MGWLSTITISKPIFPTLVQAFYSRVTYNMGGPITFTVRGVEICLDPDNICYIFDIALVGLRVYRPKMWPIMLGFEPKEAIQSICKLLDAHGMGKPLAHNLTIINRVLHYMLCFIFLPQGRHQDKVSYYETFLINSILTRRRIHLGYLTMMHMIACCKNITRVLTYGSFLTKVFNNADVDLSRKTNFKAPSTYNTYDDQFIGRMKSEKALDGSWVRKAERAPT